MVGLCRWKRKSSHPLYRCVHPLNAQMDADPGAGPDTGSAGVRLDRGYYEVRPDAPPLREAVPPPPRLWITMDKQAGADAEISGECSAWTGGFFCGAMKCSSWPTSIRSLLKYLSSHRFSFRQRDVRRATRRCDASRGGNGAGHEVSSICNKPFRVESHRITRQTRFQRFGFSFTSRGAVYWFSI